MLNQRAILRCWWVSMVLLIFGSWRAGASPSTRPAPRVSQPTEAVKETTASPKPTSRPISSLPQRKKPGGWVFLQMKRLHHLLRHKSVWKGPRLVPLRASFQGKMEKHSLTLKGKVRLKVHDVSKPLFFSLGGRGGVILGVQVNGQRVAPLRRKDGRYFLSLQQRGEHTIKYYYRLLLPRSQGEHKVTLDLPRVPQARLRLAFAGKGWLVRTAPASRVTLEEASKGTRATLQLPGSGRLQLYWKGRRVERKEQTRFRARVETLVTLQEGLLQGTSYLTIEILTGGQRNLTLTLPQTMEVLHVTGAGVTEWFQAALQNKQRKITVLFSHTLRKKQKLRLSFERAKLPQKRPVTLPTIGVPGAEQFSGIVGVQAQADTEVSHEQAQGARQVDVRSLPDRLRQQTDRPILLAYRFDSPRYHLRVRLIKHPWLKVMNTVVNRASFETVRTRAGREVTKATYHVTNNMRQFMRITLPRRARLIGAFVAGRAVRPAIAEKKTRSSHSSAAGRDYLLPLARSSGRNVGRVFAVEIVYSQAHKKLSSWGSFQSELPSTPLEVLSFRWTYYLPRSHHLLWSEGTVQPRRSRRLLRRLFHRMFQDLRLGTPQVWAGGRSPLNVYNKMGLKERFYAPSAAETTQSPTKSRRAYRSRFSRVQWQVRAKLPLVGRPLQFRGNLLRGKAPRLTIWYSAHQINRFWFWFVLLGTLLATVLLLNSMLGRRGVLWGRIVGSLLLFGFFFAVGYVMPMTYLAGLRGMLYGFWAACLLRLAWLARDEAFFPRYLVFARWWAVGLSFLILLIDQVDFQLGALFLALPVYPALLRRKRKASPSSSGSSSPAPSSADSPSSRPPSQRSSSPDSSFASSSPDSSSATTSSSDSSSPASQEPSPPSTPPEKEESPPPDREEPSADTPKKGGTP